MRVTRREWLALHYAKGPGNFGRKLIAWGPFRLLPTGIKNLWRWSTYSDRNSPFCFDKLVHCRTSFYLYRELGKEIKNGKSYSSWLVQFHRKLPVGLVQWKAPLKINFIKACLWTLVSRWKTNWFSKFEGWDELRKLPWNYSFMKKALYIYSWKSIQLKDCPLKAGVQLNLGEILWKVLEHDQTVERPWYGIPGWWAMFGARLPVFDF